ncbi:MAG: hypothetical protein H6Q19_287, partial [Bacteroidetes bacterium]|nr:hypothetical protein [Bacteroidota bacterium]
MFLTFSAEFKNIFLKFMITLIISVFVIGY